MKALQTQFQRGVYYLLLLVLAACSLGETPGLEHDGRPDADISTTGTPVPSPTALSAPALIERALAAREVGREEQVAQDLSTLLNAHPDADETRQATYYLAESYARRGHWASANTTFQSLLGTGVQDELTARALFWLARGYEEAGDWANAIATYDQYRALATPLEPYAAIRQAALYQAQDQLEEAARLYEYGATATMAHSERAGSYEKAIALRRQLGQGSAALQLYTQLLEMAENPGYRATILAEAVDLAQELGQADQARAWLLEIVTETPTTAEAIHAARELIAAGDPGLSAAAAAWIFFTAELYTEALPLFDAAIAEAQAAEGGGSPEVLELQRLRGLTLRGLGQFPEAIDALAAVGSASPDSEPGRQALLDWIQTIGQSGATQEAADKYRNYAASYPDDPRAPVALDRAAQLLDRLEQSDEALKVRFELGQRYPESELSPPALHTVGSAYFYAEQWREAQYVWQLLAENQRGAEQARGAFWAARAAQKQAAMDQAHALFERAYNAAPDTYHGTRAADELALTMTPTLTLDAPITAEDWLELEAWIADWAEAPDDAAEKQPASDSGFAERALELGAVGMESEARAEWNSAREVRATDPLGLMQVARQAHLHGETYTALKTAEQLAALVPDPAAPLPETLRRLIFPAPYVDLVLTESQEQGVDPRLFYALMRQESLFNPGATSWVGARGLAQVMPATGQGIAQRLAVADFHPDDLYQPHVSVRFGTFYIGQQIQTMGGSIHGGLAAYNGGPGNAQRWANGTTVTDPDLYMQGIDYPETRHYVRLVYGYYGAYRRLYALP
jgi:soluble lytic murein transglycosylase